MESWRASILCGALLLSAGCAEPPPSVLLVVLDTVRADRTSTYGYARPTTIQLDAVARSGVVFEDASASAPWTWPSHASLFTGQPPWVHGAHMVAAGDTALEVDGIRLGTIREDLPTLAERFADAGYRTVSLATNELLRPELGLVRGFEDARTFETDAGVMKAAFAEIEREDEGPVLLFLNLMSAHAPYREGPGPWAASEPALLTAAGAPGWARPYLTTKGAPGLDLAKVPDDGDTLDGQTRFVAGELDIPPEGLALLSHLYDSGVRQADFVLGRVVETWARRHPAGIVAVTSDHGEALGEHGNLGHLATLYPEVLRVPLVIAAPGRLAPGRRVSKPVPMHALHATLLDLAGIEAGPDSLRSLAAGGEPSGTPPPVTASAWPYAPWARGVGGRFARRWHLYREGDRALLWDGVAVAELFDLASDPGMKIDVAGREPERVTTLLAAAQRNFGATRDGPPVEIGDDVQERLRELGYVIH